MREDILNIAESYMDGKCDNKPQYSVDPSATEASDNSTVHTIKIEIFYKNT